MKVSHVIGSWGHGMYREQAGFPEQYRGRRPATKRMLQLPLFRWYLRNDPVNVLVVFQTGLVWAWSDSKNPLGSV